MRFAKVASVLRFRRYYPSTTIPKPYRRIPFALPVRAQDDVVAILHPAADFTGSEVDVARAVE